MTSRFPALRHQGVDTRFLRCLRLAKAGNAGQEKAPSLFQCFDSLRFRESEMEADDGRSQFNQKAQHLVVFSEATIDDAQGRWRLGIEPSEC